MKILDYPTSDLARSKSVLTRAGLSRLGITSIKWWPWFNTRKRVWITVQHPIFNAKLIFIIIQKSYTIDTTNTTIIITSRISSKVCASARYYI